MKKQYRVKKSEEIEKIIKEKNVDIKAYGNYEPSLTDIFIDKAGEVEEEIKDDNKNNKEEE